MFRNSSPPTHTAVSQKSDERIQRTIVESFRESSSLIRLCAK